MFLKAWLWILMGSRSVVQCSHVQAQCPLCAIAVGQFPFPREKGTEKGTGQSVAGVDRKPDFLQKSG